MRKAFYDESEIEETREDNESLSEALLRAAPWASAIRTVEGGWMAFESITDATTWDNQL